MTADEAFLKSKAEIGNALGELFGISGKSEILSRDDLGIIVISVPNIGVIPVVFKVNTARGESLSGESVKNLLRSALYNLYSFDDPKIREEILQDFDKGEIYVADFIQAYGHLLRSIPTEPSLAAPELPVYLIFKGKIA